MTISPPTYDDDVIDVRLCLRQLLAHWRLLAGAAVAAAALAAGIYWLLPAAYEANALVVVINPRFRLNFDDKIETEDEQPNPKALLGLAVSGDLLTRLADDPAVNQGQTDLSPEALRESLQATAGADPTLLEFTASAGAPEQAAALANAWSRLYVDYVNALYGYDQDGKTAFAPQVDSARAEYDAAQQALEAFLQDNRRAEFERELSIRQYLLGVYQTTLEQGQALAPEEQFKYRSQLLGSAYAELLAQDEQQHALIAEYVQHLGGIEQALLDVRALRLQVSSGSASASAVQSDALAQLLLRGRLPGNSQNVTLQIDLSVPAQPVSVGDVDGLIVVLQARREAAQAQLQALLALAEGRAPDPEVVLDSRVEALASVKAALQLQVETLNTELYAALPAVPAVAADLAGREVSRLNEEVLAFEAGLEAEAARQRELSEARDLAWETYAILQRKATERQIASQTGNAVVRLASQARPPEAPVTADKSIQAVLAGLAVIGLSLMGVLGYEWLRGDSSLPAQVSPEPGH